MGVRRKEVGGGMGGIRKVGVTQLDIFLWRGAYGTRRNDQNGALKIRCSARKGRAKRRGFTLGGDGGRVWRRGLGEGPFWLKELRSLYERPRGATCPARERKKLSHFLLEASCKIRKEKRVLIKGASTALR